MFLKLTLHPLLPDLSDVACIVELIRNLTLSCEFNWINLNCQLLLEIDGCLQCQVWSQMESDRYNLSRNCQTQPNQMRWSQIDRSRNTSLHKTHLSISLPIPPQAISFFSFFFFVMKPLPLMFVTFIYNDFNKKLRKRNKNLFAINLQRFHHDLIYFSLHWRFIDGPLKFQHTFPSHVCWWFGGLRGTVGWYMREHVRYRTTGHFSALVPLWNA